MLERALLETARTGVWRRASDLAPK